MKKFEASKYYRYVLRRDIEMSHEDIRISANNMYSFDDVYYSVAHSFSKAIYTFDLGGLSWTSFTMVTGDDHPKRLGKIMTTYYKRFLEKRLDLPFKYLDSDEYNFGDLLEIAGKKLIDEGKQLQKYFEV